MLREILGVRQDEPQIERRWFHDEYFDLFVWQERSGQLRAFQLCYGEPGSEKALVWDEEQGYFHDGVDQQSMKAGEALGFSPFKPSGPDPIAARFELAACSLPDRLRTIVSERINKYAADAKPATCRRKEFRRADWQHQS